MLGREVGCSVLMDKYSWLRLEYRTLVDTESCLVGLSPPPNTPTQSGGGCGDGGVAAHATVMM